MSSLLTRVLARLGVQPVSVYKVENWHESIWPFGFWSKAFDSEGDIRSWISVEDYYVTEDEALAIAQRLAEKHVDTKFRVRREQVKGGVQIA